MRLRIAWGRLGMSFDKYLIVFDTNILYVQYKKKADFTKFYFNSTFKNIIDKVEELDLYKNIEIGIPSVVWQEMKRQKIDSYNSNVETLEQKMKKYQFPFHKFDKLDGDYELYLDKKIEEFKQLLSKRIVNIVDIDFPSKQRFERIINRAFEKKPPFDGGTGVSDKGFKDTLLWESILEHKSVNNDVDIILYSDDKLFNEVLVEEFQEEFSGSELFMFGKNQEEQLINKLETIALKIDKYTYIANSEDGIDTIKNWVFSKDFAQQLYGFQKFLKEINKYTKLEKVEVEEIYDIENLTDDEFITDVRISLSANYNFSVLEKNFVTEKHDVVIYANSTNGKEFIIDDVESEQGDVDVV
jgi:hypothetical protein